MTHLSLGRHREAQTLLRPSLEICRNGGNVLFQLWVLPALAEVCLETGRLDEARRCVGDATRLMVPGRNWYGLPGGVDLVRAMLATVERRWDEAEQTFERAVEINQRYALPFDEARTLAAWGRMHLARGVAGDRAHARDRLGEALEIFERLEATGEIPKLREMLDPLRA